MRSGPLDLAQGPPDTKRDSPRLQAQLQTPGSAARSTVQVQANPGTDPSTVCHMSAHKILVRDTRPALPVLQCCDKEAAVLPWLGLGACGRACIGFEHTRHGVCPSWDTWRACSPSTGPCSAAQSAPVSRPGLGQWQHRQQGRVRPGGAPQRERYSQQAGGGALQRTVLSGRVAGRWRRRRAAALLAVVPHRAGGDAHAQLCAQRQRTGFRAGRLGHGARGACPGRLLQRARRPGNRARILEPGVGGVCACRGLAPRVHKGTHLAL